jgi:hypothetical protein
MPGDQIATAPSLADDILRGAPAIARFLGEDVRYVYYLCAQGYIPCGKVGDRWIASKARLRRHYETVVSGEAGT